MIYFYFRTLLMMLRIFKKVFIILLLILFKNTTAQISHGGRPTFLSSKIKSSIVYEQLPSLPIANIKSSIVTNSIRRVKNEQYAHVFDVNYSIKKSGTWKKMNDGRKVWQLSLQSKGAYSLGVVFTKFRLPKEGKIFIYNTEIGRFLGAYTSQNNKEYGTFTVEPLEGDHLTIEYIETANPEFEAEIVVGKILHDYKNIFRVLKSRVKRESGSCNVDINCKEGEDWKIVKRSVCHILSQGYYSSGALINNTNNDGKPFLLSAYHAFQNSSAAREAVFYFNYENSVCQARDASKSQSISGADLLANTTQLDFALLKLSVKPPVSYSVYYSGWDRTGVIPAKTVCIHHPNGDSKKISLDYDAPIIATYSDSKYSFKENTHWKILQWDVGTTEGGSSGSPLFDQNHRIIGDLTGGDASCGHSVNDFFARFADSWDTFPEKHRQLKAWLDPINSGQTILDGFDPTFQINANKKCVGDNFVVEIIQDKESGDYQWDFGENAIPKNASGKGPHTFHYTTSGAKLITLNYKNNNGEKIEIKKEVVSGIKLDFDYTIHQTQIKLKNKSSFSNNYEWNFGDGNSSELTSPTHNYVSSGVYLIQLKGENNCGIETISKTVKTSYKQNLKVYPNPSDGKFTVDLGNVIFDKINWSVFSLRGAKIKGGIISNFEKQLVFNLDGNASGVYILTLNVDGEELQYKLVLID